MSLQVKRKFFCKIAEGSLSSQELLASAKKAGCDIYVFDGLEELDYDALLFECGFSHVSVQDNVAKISITTYEDWHRQVCRKWQHDYIAKSRRKGLTVQIVQPTEQILQDMCEIYNETPVRQDRHFRHYGMTLEQLRKTKDEPLLLIGAFRNGKLVGFLKLEIQGDVASFAQFLSLVKERDTRVNSALIAKAVEVCVEKKLLYLVYARMGNHPSLDRFKRSNGFDRFVFRRYYILLTLKGRILTMLRLHRELKSLIPESLKSYLIPAYSWFSRLKAIRSKRVITV